MIIRTIAKYVGQRSGVTPKAKAEYMDFFLHFLGPDGEPDIEQCKIRSYSADIIALGHVLQPGTMVELELDVRDATLSMIEPGRED